MTLIPEGTWRGRAITWEYGWTSSDVEQIGIQLVLSADQHPEVDGRWLTWYGTFSEKAEPYTLKALRTLGWSGDDLGDLSGIELNEVDVVVVHELDPSGNERARARFINPIGSGGVAMKNKMLPEQVAAFAERMRGKVLAASAKAGKPAPARAPTPAPASQPSAAAKRAQAAAQKAAAASSGPAVATGIDADDVPF